MRRRMVYSRIFIVLIVSFLLVPTLAMAKPGVSRMHTLGLNAPEKMRPNGGYVVEAFVSNQWKEAGRIAFDKYLRDREIDLDKFASGIGSIKIRLTEQGGGAAHIDAVSFGGRAPAAVSAADRQSAQDRRIWDAQALAKVSRKDFDVVDVYGKILELSFPADGNDKVLRVTARIEPTVISKTPFQFPRQNLYRAMDTQAGFYQYRLDSAKGFLRFDEISRQKPFFKEFSLSGSGHPSGYTYGWVRNDDTNLYVSIDFTPDNTYDGDKDYAKVYAKTPAGLKEFKVSVPEPRWGKPLFTYTDKVAYQHKAYEFAIPLRELGVADTKALKDQSLELAFATYGTATPAGDYNPSVSYDSVNNRYLLVYDKVSTDLLSRHIYGQLINDNGTVFAGEFAICTGSSSCQYPAVSYDSSNQRFLVVWEDSRDSGTTGTDVYGQLVNAAGTLSGSNFVISNQADNQHNPSIAYNSVTPGFLAVWHDYRNGNWDIYGQLVNASGTLSGAGFPISNEASVQFHPSVAFDGVTGRYLVAWQDSRNASTDIYGQLVNQAGAPVETTVGNNLVISNASGNQSFASVANDNVNHRFLVAWEDTRVAANSIYSQLVVAASGALFGTASDVNVAISTQVGPYQIYPSLAFDSLNRRHLVSWLDFRNSGTTDHDIYGQLVQADAAAYYPAADTNMVISNAILDQAAPAVAYNSTCTNFLAVYETGEAGVPDIGLALVEYGVRDVRSANPILNFMTLTEAFAAGLLAGGDILEAREQQFDEGTGLNFDRTLAVTLKGGYDSCYTTNSGLYSAISPSLTVSRGALTIENIIVQ